MEINPEIIGFIAGGLSSALFIPQIIKILREKSAEEISLLTCIIGIVSSALWLWYGILQDHISMMVTNSIAVGATAVLVVLRLIYNGEKN
ncbi:SemiSWEET family transporter [Kaistella sp. PBT33-4]|uniref:SemiSWEET family sugar transporter n=1 Tax=Kaistella sp. PBT33-4 TaxID=3032000 RepID=UPI0023D837F5|nr:SemiSWEET family transporter [Kaistella sp. PBT33-4]MDF0719130.1 SemiSWEET family transporter [Kaistella sp. PBT33-4]